MLGAVARGLETRAAAQRAADLAALAGARAMHDSYSRLFEPPLIDGRPNRHHLEKAAYLASAGRRPSAWRRERSAAAPRSRSRTRPRSHPCASAPPSSGRSCSPGGGCGCGAHAEAELAPPGGGGLAGFASGGGYDGPLAYRQGKPMRPDVAQAFDRMATAARG